jgi:uncharacterized protein YndB with AHSA1/START domain
VDADDVAVREIYIEATSAEVFPYLTDPAQHVNWMGRAAQFDLRPGGIHRLDVNGLGTLVGGYLELDSPRRRKYTCRSSRASSPRRKTAAAIPAYQDTEEER